MTPKCRQTIKEMKRYVHWGCISLSQKLTEDFIRKMKKKVDWNGVSRRQKLSPEFIKEFENDVNWTHISSEQKLDIDSITELQERIDWYLLLWKNPHIIIDDYFVMKFQDKIEEFGTEKLKHRLKNVQNKIVDRTYDIILT